MSAVKNQIIKGSLWISAARGTANLMNALCTIILARLLLPTDFGLVALAMSMLMMLEAFTELSLSQALIHAENPTPDHYNTAWSLGLARGLLIGVGFALAAPLVAGIYNEPRLEGVMFALGTASALGGLRNPKLIALQKELQFHQEAITSVSSTLTNVVVSLAVAAIFRSYWALLAGLLTGQATRIILSYVILPFRPALRLTHFAELWRFSVWVSLGNVVNTMNYRFDQLLVGTYLGQGELGLYTVGSRLAVLAGQEIVRPLTQTLFPAFRMTAEDPGRLLRAYERVQGLVTAIALPTSVGVALIADPLVRLTLGEKWHGAIPVVQLLAAIYSIDTLGSLVTPLGMAKGETRHLFMRNVQKLAIRLPLIAAGLVFGGFMGLLYSRAVAGIIGVTIDMTMIRRLIGITILQQLRANLRAIISTAMMSVVVLSLHHVLPQHDSVSTMGTLGMDIVVAIATYVLTSWALWMASGRPHGPETEAIDFAMMLARTAGNRWARLRASNIH